MLQITGLTNNAKQTLTFILPNGEPLAISLEYKPLQLGWFMNLTYRAKDFTLNNVRVVGSPNFLHPFKNLVPFGMGCFVENNQEPFLQDDFKTGRALLYVLDETDLSQFEEILSG